LPIKQRTLEIDEDIDFQRKEWMWQRAGMVLLFLLVAGALVGMTGGGGRFSLAEAGDAAGPVHLEYERIVRRGAMSTLTLQLRASPGDVKVWVEAPYFQNVRVDTVAPPPTRVSVEPARHVYTIHAGSAPVTVKLYVEHTTLGRIEGEVGLVGGPSVRFTQWSLF
jgi:hypothetical protein